MADYFLLISVSVHTEILYLGLAGSWPFLSLFSIGKGFSTLLFALDDESRMIYLTGETG